MREIQLSAEQMAIYRVAGKSHITYRAMKFTSEQMNERRMWMRRTLQGTMFQNSSNERLDCMRVWRDTVYNALFVEDENGYELFIPNSQISASLASYRRQRARIPKEYDGKFGKDFDWNIYGIDITDQKDKVNRYVMHFTEFSEKGMGLYIHSKEKGSGKTMLACCILNELSKKYVGSVKFVNVVDFLEMTKKGFNYDDPEVEELYICKTLVLDDIGAQMDKKWVDSVLYRLINERYNNHKATIYTSNIDVDKLSMDSRIIDRIESRSFMVDLPEVPVRRMLSEERKEKMLKENAP